MHDFVWFLNKNRIRKAHRLPGRDFALFLIQNWIWKAQGARQPINDFAWFLKNNWLRRAHRRRHCSEVAESATLETVLPKLSQQEPNNHRTLKTLITKCFQWYFHFLACGKPVINYCFTSFYCFFRSCNGGLSLAVWGQASAQERETSNPCFQ